MLSFNEYMDNKQKLRWKFNNMVITNSINEAFIKYCRRFPIK